MDSRNDNSKYQWTTRTLLHYGIRPIKRIIVAIIGGTVILFGLALIVLPGPAIVVIPLGLAILATEFVWARRWMRKARYILYRLKPGRAKNGKGNETRGKPSKP